MRTLTLTSAILAIAMGNLYGKSLDASTVTRIAVDANTDDVDLSVKNGPYNDGKMEVIDAKNYDEKTFFVQVQKPASCNDLDAFYERVAKVADAFLAREVKNGEFEQKAEQFATIAVADLGRGIQTWTTIQCTRLPGGNYKVQDLGPVNIEKLDNDKFAIAFNGWANIIDKPEMLEALPDPDKMSNILMKGVQLKDGAFLTRTPSGYGLQATNGFKTWLYNQALELVQDDEVGAVILPAIDEFGQHNGRITRVAGDINDWDVFTGDKDDFVNRGQNTPILECYEQAAA